MVIELPGWQFYVESDVMHVVGPTPLNARGAGEFVGLRASFAIKGMTDTQIARRAFATVQYLTDHELREHFLVDGARAFEPHDPSVTGEQHDWWVEAESAVRGY